MQDKLFSVIVPLYKKGYETLPRFLQQLQEQDYKNYEIIFVHNSPDNEGKKYLTSKKGPLLKFKKSNVDRRIIEKDAGYDPELGTGNHANAFNVGAKWAKGDYFLFWDPEIYALPGVLREFKDAFDAHPEADFVYGDYELEGAGAIIGRTYNEYELRCANYISGAFPIRAKAFCGWNPEVKALQDWDMWLSAVDNGAKGYYLGRPCFTTAAPTGDGISAYGHEHWEEVYNKVRSLHGFPTSKTVVTSLGAPIHATNSAKALEVDTRVHNNIFIGKPHSYENIYLLGFYPTAPQNKQAYLDHIGLFYKGGTVGGELAGKKRIIHWIGTDIYLMQHAVSWMAERSITKMLNDKDYDFVHLAESEFTQKELADLGIKAEVVPLPIEKKHEYIPWPEEFTVGVYINPSQDMYYEELMYQLADAMPDVKFKFFGNPNKAAVVQDNKEWVGWVEMEEFIPKISAMVRITKHDGLPISPIEAMMAGRSAITSVPLKHATQHKAIEGIPSLENLIEEIRAIQTKGQELSHGKAASYWKKHMSPETYKKRMGEYFSE